MDSAKWQTIKSTFSAILDLPETERPQFLTDCDAEVRREVEKLLKSHEKADDFIDEPFFIKQGFAKNGFEENLVGKKIDDYLILEKIGEGGMGTVFLVEHCGEDFSQKVALKLIKRGMDTNAVLKRFLMERQILSQLEHPNIARLLDGGSTKDDLPYFVMEYVEGENIREFCENHRFATNERLEIFQKVCQAIAYAHQKLIVHRDIKPSNIIVTKDGTPKLLDFGIAKLLSPDWNTETAEATATNFRLMTPEYASPEQLRGQPTTTATDVYSLGVVLYELLTGTRPFNFKSKNPIEISEEILTKEPVRPSSVVSRPLPIGNGKITSPNGQRTTNNGQRTNLKFLKGDLDNIILKAIKSEPMRRYKSVEEFCEDIRRYLVGLPVKATADSRIYRFQKFVQRHRTGVAATALVSLFLLVSTGVTSWQFFVARQERAKAEQRFRELRGVAKSLLTDTNSALKKLPENLEIRKSIIEKSIAVLDNLAVEESDDADFLSELADAYHELGNLQHWNFRETDKALDNFQKSRALCEKAILLAPQKVEYRRKLIQTISGIVELYAYSGNTEKVLEYSQIAHSNLLEILRLEPENAETCFYLSAQSEILSDSLKNIGREAESTGFERESIEFINRAIELQTAKEKTPANGEKMAFYMMQKGSLLQKSGQTDEALKIYQTTADIAKNAFLSDNSQRLAFNHTARLHRLMAEIYRGRGDWVKALEMYQFSLEWVRQGRKYENLPPAELTLGEAVYTMRVGVALDKNGQKTGGAEMVAAGLQNYYKYLDAYSKDAAHLIYAPEFLEIAAGFYQEQKQTEKAVGIWADYARRIEIALEKTPNETALLRYLSGAYQNSGDVYAAQNPSKAKAVYEKALEILRKTVTTSPDFQKREADLVGKIENLK